MLILKFVHISFMFAGVALALGGGTVVALIARSGDVRSIRSAVGVMTRAQPLIPTFFWEILMTSWPIKFASYTLTNNLRGMLLPMIFDGRRGPLYKYVRNFHLPDYREASMFLSILAGLFLVTAMVAAMNRSIEGKEAR